MGDEMRLIGDAAQEMEGEHGEERADEDAVKPLEIPILESPDNGIVVEVAFADGVVVLVMAVDGQ